MGIVSAREIWDDRDFSVDARITREYVRSFRVITDDPRITHLQVVFAPGLPQLYSYYQTIFEFDTGSICNRINAKHDQGDPCAWVVNFYYSSRALDPALQSQAGAAGGGGGGGSVQNENPTLRPPQFSWGAVSDSVPIEKSLDTPARVFKNSAGELFNPKPTVDKTRRTLTIVRNELHFTAPFYDDFHDYVNTNAIWGYGARQVKCKRIVGVRAWENGIPHWEVTYEFEMRKPDWDGHYLDQGTSVLGNNGKPARIFNDGIAISEPVQLNGAGAVAASGAAPYILDFKKYPERAFEELALDVPF